LAQDNTYIPLIYGEFDNRKFTINGSQLINTLADTLSTPFSCAGFEVRATGKGLLLPRLTLAQRSGVPSPSGGLVIYQTDNTSGVKVFNGSAWDSLTTDTKLNASGSYLESLISASNAGVSTLNGGSGNLIITGAGSVTVSRVSQTITVSGGSSASPFAWTKVTGATAITLNSGYLTSGVSGGGRVTLTLPTSAELGSYFKASSINASGFKIAQNSGQVIYFGDTSSTVGSGGYIQSTATRDSVEIVCIGTNFEFQVVSSVGNINLV
jgi:hypothetical protein